MDPRVRVGTTPLRPGNSSRSFGKGVFQQNRPTSVVHLFGSGHSKSGYTDPIKALLHRALSGEIVASAGEKASFYTMMNRRKVIGAMVVALLSTRIAAATAQGGKVPRLGILLFNSPRAEPIGPLLQSLEAMGYVDGKTIAIEYRFAEGKPELLPALAAELVQLKPDVIFALGGDVAPFAKNATTSIPIVAWTSNDPVESGLVASISRPGGNVTGITLVYDELAGKTLGLLKEAVPAISRVAVLWNPDHADPEFRETKRAAGALGVQLQSLEVRRPDDFGAAFKAALSARAEGLVIVSPVGANGGFEAEARQSPLGCGLNRWIQHTMARAINACGPLAQALGRPATCRTGPPAGFRPWRWVK